MKVIAIGIDGLDYIPFMSYLYSRKGRGFREILENGILFKNIISTTPPMSPSAWSSIFTGLTPDRHGIYDFYVIDEITNRFKVATANMLPYTIFDILSVGGIKQILINIPFLYPPKRVNGILISGLPSPYSTPSTFPKYIGREIERRGLIVGEPPWSIKINILKRSIVDRSTLTWEYLDQLDWDFLMIVFRETDIAQHYFWGSNGNIYNIYYYIDKYMITPLVEQFRNYKEDVLLIIFGDHGFTRGLGTFNIVNWLIDMGLGVRYGGLINHFKRYIEKLIAKIYSLDEILPFISILQPLYLKGIFDILTIGNGILNPSSGVIDKGGILYLNPNYENLRIKLYKYLLNKISYDIGIENFNLVSKYCRKSPDYILELKDGIISNPYSSETDIYINKVPPARRGVHKKQTIMLISNISKNIHLRYHVNNNLYYVWDIASIILYINGILPPKFFDGKVPSNIINNIHRINRFKDIPYNYQLKLRTKLMKLQDV